jgi:hypothetical protein
MRSKIYFLTYLNRSGSTLLAKKLAQFPEVGMGIEGKLIDGIQRGEVNINNEDELNEYLELNYADLKFKRWGISKNVLKYNLINKYDYPINFNNFISESLYLFFSNERKKVYIHKQGRYFNHIKKLRTLFPGTKVIFIKRDPRAIYNSLKKTKNSTNGKIMQDDIIAFSNTYIKTERIIKKYLDVDYFYIIKYEDLVRNEENELDKLKAFLGLIKNRELSNNSYYNYIPPEQHHLHKNIRKDNIFKRINAWEKELEDWEIYVLERILKNHIEKNNYFVQGIKFKSLKKKISVLNLLLRSFFEITLLSNIK